MASIISRIRAFVVFIIHSVSSLWKQFRARPKWQQYVGGLILIAVLFGLSTLFGKAPENLSASASRAVTIRSVAELSGNSTGESVIGNVRSRSEAEILSEAGGTVKRVNTSIGASVPAGFVIAELENASERASVLQAEGAYDAAIASRGAVSSVDVSVTARNAYRSAFTTLDTTLENYVDAFFGDNSLYGPRVLLGHLQTDPANLSRARTQLDESMSAWRKVLPETDSRNPETLLNEAEVVTRSVETLVEEIARSANDPGSGVTDAQITALASARSGVNGVLASIASARAVNRSGSVSSTASVDASVKSALGTLRLAQANLERTVVRAPIAGQVNFLPIRVGDYVTSFMHVATVAQNGALEIVAYVSEETRTELSVGAAVSIEDQYPGTITAIAPALDPITKQIEVRIAVNETTTLTNGQSVRITLPSSSQPTTEITGPVLLPLSAVKLSADSRVVFSVGTDGRLVAIPVTIGDVRGERIEITSTLARDVRIVTDARGLSEGALVRIASETL